MTILEKLTKKTVIDNGDIQYLGNTKQLMAIINDAKGKYEDPHFLVLRDKEGDEISLRVFEGKIPDIEMSPLFGGKL